MHTVIHLVECNPTRNEKLPTGLKKHVIASRFGRGVRTPVSDPYLLLLLANQELVGGREGQARCLIEAAYEIFDRKAEANAFKLDQAG